jgi:predicted AlkP superfamily phosphohydrolase/phosphomutase
MAAQPSFDDFGKKFKAAVAKGDVNAIVNMMEFPFSSFDWGAYVAQLNSQIETREDFLKIPKKIFTKKVVQAIAKNEFKKIEDESDGTFYYTLIFYRSEQSAAWITFNQVNGQWKAVATDNVSN